MTEEQAFEQLLKNISPTPEDDKNVKEALENTTNYLKYGLPVPKSIGLGKAEDGEDSVTLRF